MTEESDKNKEWDGDIFEDICDMREAMGLPRMPVKPVLRGSKPKGTIGPLKGTDPRKEKNLITVPPWAEESIILNPDLRFHEFYLAGLTKEKE